MMSDPENQNNKQLLINESVHDDSGKYTNDINDSHHIQFVDDDEIQESNEKTVRKKANLLSVDE